MSTAPSRPGVRQCGARRGAGRASGYLESLVRQGEIRGGEAIGRWYAQHPDVVDADEAERLAAADELGETA